MTHDKLIKGLTRVVREEYIVSNPLEKLAYSHDLAPVLGFISLLFRITPDVIVSPSNVEQIPEILKIANKYKAPAIPRGAATWGFGGVVPTRGGILLDLRRLNRIIGLNDKRAY